MPVHGELGDDDSSAESLSARWSTPGSNVPTSWSRTGDLTRRGTRQPQAGACGAVTPARMRRARPLLVVPGNHAASSGGYRVFAGAVSDRGPLAQLPARSSVSPSRRPSRRSGSGRRRRPNSSPRLNSACPLRHRRAACGPASRRTSSMRAGRIAARAGRAGCAARRGAPSSTPRRAATRTQTTAAAPSRRARSVARRGGRTGARRPHPSGAGLCEAPRVSLTVDGTAGCLRLRPPGPVSRRRGEACGVLVYTVEAETIRVDSLLWHEPSFVPIATRQIRC